MSLRDVCHQGLAQRFLQRALAEERLSHAYLFHGPDGVGKETLALGLAELLLCERPVEHRLSADERSVLGVEALRTGCGRCDDCRGVAADAHPDLHLVHRYRIREHPDPEVKRRKGLEIGIDVVRRFIIEPLGLTPIRGRARVVIVREADAITRQAQNAVLKTLEEPPGAVYLILLVSALDSLLATTRSRCAVVRFNPLPASFVRNRLAELRPALSTEEREWYVRCGGGSLGWALEAAEEELHRLRGVVSADLMALHGRRVDSGPVAAGKASSKSKPAARAAAKSNSSDDDGLVKQWIGLARAFGERRQKRDPDISDTEALRRGLGILLRVAADWYAEQMRFAVGEVGSPLPTSPSGDERAAPWEGWAEAINRIALAERQLDLNAHAELCIECLMNDLPSLSIRADALALP